MKLNVLLNRGMSTIVATLGRYYFNYEVGRAFIRSVQKDFSVNKDKRDLYRAEGIEVPPFLIASIASQCNLNCAGCYSRSNGVCSDIQAQDDLTSAQWNEVFKQASDLGVSFILLAGGEPTLRDDVLAVAATHKNIVFPVFMNGTTLNDELIQFFDQNRNLVPILSLEGDREETDGRRGQGVYSMLERAMDRFKELGILYGASITVTRKNLKEVTNDDFLDNLRDRGCGATIFVEYVPLDRSTENLVLTDEDLEYLIDRQSKLKKAYKEMLVIAFPGDEEKLGGCLASGRGFFHISPSGSAEPCPFSPYSKLNVKNDSLIEILKSKYFKELRDLAQSVDEHEGGCTLFQHEDRVLKLLNA